MAPTAKQKKSRSASPKSRLPAKREPGGKILITGIAGALGKLLAKRLARTERVVGIDLRPFHGRPKKIEYHQIDIRKRKAENIFRKEKLKAVVHLNILHNPQATQDERIEFNITVMNRLLEYCVTYKVPRLVILSSADVYGPNPRNPAFLTEDAPLKAGWRFAGIRDMIEIDLLGSNFLWQHRGTKTIILRPVHIIGPTVRNNFSNYLRFKAVPMMAGFDPMIQVIHEEDTVEALALAVHARVTGIFNIEGPGAVPISVIIKERGAVPVPIPSILAPAFWRWFRRYIYLVSGRHIKFSTADMDYLKFPCNVDGRKTREILKFQPNYTLRDTITSLNR